MQIRVLLSGASLLLAAFILASAPARADIPRTINYSGVLNNAAGNPLPDGTVQITFRLYDALTGGNLLWTEASKSVTVSGGHGAFQTVLGSPTPFGALAFNVPYWVEVQVGNDPPMSPRAPLLSAPYALNAGGASLSLPYFGTGAVPEGNVLFEIDNNASGNTIVARAAGVSSALYGGNSGNGPGIYGISGTSTGVAGRSTSGSGTTGQSDSWIGVYGQSTSAAGVWGRSSTNTGVYGSSDGAGIGVFGESAASEGVRGTSHNIDHGGVVGINTAGGIAVYGTSDGAGVAGYSNKWIGTYGESQVFDGVQGVSRANGHAGVAGISSANGFGVYGRSDGGGYAGWFDGRVRVAVLEIAGGSDLAEKFDVSQAAEPGTVMAIDPDRPGKLRIASAAYDTTVAGVLSGANKLAAGMVLPDANGAKGAEPLAMSGRVWVKCDARYGAIRPGDLLTTSDTPGHAMKVADHTRAPGATLGKAMTALPEGRGMVLALVSLQ